MYLVAPTPCEYRVPKLAQSDLCRFLHILSFRLEAEDLVIELADGAGLGVAERLGSLLHGADHGRRTAEEDLDIRSGSRETFLQVLFVNHCNRLLDRTNRTHLDHVRGNEADTTSPSLGRVVENVVDAETIVLGNELLELLLEQDIVGVDIGEDQVHLSGVVSTVAGTVADNGLDDLEHRGDTGTSSDHTDVAAHVGGVDHGTLGAAHLHGLADLQGGQVLGNVTLGVSLDEEVKVAGFIVGGDGGVGAHNLLGLAVNGGCERDVLADGQTENVGGAGQGEAVDGHVVGDLVLFLQEVVLELGRVQDLSRFCRACQPICACDIPRLLHLLGAPPPDASSLKPVKMAAAATA